MNSKVLKMYDLDLAISEYEWNPSYDEKEIQEKMYQAALDYKAYTPMDLVHDGAIVEVSMKSSLPKFNRKCKILVGKKMFDKEFESELIDKEKNKNYEYYHSVAGMIQYMIDEITILFVHPLTDDQAVEQAAIHHYPDIHTAEDYRNYLVNKAKRVDIIHKSYDFLNHFYIQKCELQIDEKDMEYLVEAEMERCRGIGRTLGKDFDKMEGDELLDAVGRKTIPEFKKMVYDMFLEVLKVDLIAKEFLKLEEEITYEKRYDIYNKVVYYITDHMMGEFKEDL